MEEEVKGWSPDKQRVDPLEKVTMASPVNHLSPSFSKRKLSGQDKPRKILRTGRRMIYEPENDELEGENVEQSFTDAFALIAAEHTDDDAIPQQYYLENQVRKPVKPGSMPTNHVYTESSIDLNKDSHERNDTANKSQKITFENSENDEPSEKIDEPSLGPHALGLVPVYKPTPPQTRTASPPRESLKQHHRLEERISILEQQLLSLQHKHELLQQSHEKLTQLVEAQNHLLACHTAPPPTKEALSTFPPDESGLLQSPQELVVTTPTSSESAIFTRVIPMPNEHYQLPRKVTAKDIIHLWEEGTRTVPPVKNWSPAQKMKIQSKLSRWKKIIDIFKGECDSDLERFEQKYTSDAGDLLPVTTILALHENQLSSDFLSKGFSNTKQNTIDIKTPTNIKAENENDVDAPEMTSEDSSINDEVVTVPEPMAVDGKTNRYVLPRKVNAREVVHLWESGCSDFPAIATWAKAQKIGQETKIFRWKKIVDIFKKDCNSDWDLFTERYSNEKAEMLPLATILAKHDAIYAEEQLEISRQNAELVKESGHDTEMTPSTPTTPDDRKTYRVPRDPESIPLPRKVTAFEVIRYWTEGSELFGPVKDWTRAQKMGQETKISRWKKIYEIFRYQCHRDWDEFCNRYTNARGELLPLATILAKYESENPAAPPSYHVHALRSPGSATPGSLSQATNGDQLPIGIPEPTNIEITANDNGEYTLPKKMSAMDALSLWEHGTEQVPPLKSWTEEQVVQKEQFASIKRIAEIYENESGGFYRRFVERFSDTDGEMLPISGIVYSSDCRKYSPYFTIYGKSIKQSRSRCEQYELPKRCGAKEIVWLWEHGCRDFPPVKAWSSGQKLRYTTKLSRWKKIVEIFHQKCDSSWRVYEEKYSNTNGELLAISTVISMQDDTDSDSYASMIKRSSNSPETSTKLLSVPTSSDASTALTPQNSADSDFELSTNGAEVKNDGKTDSGDFYLPRRVNALDIINFWERGFGNMPPVAQWSPLQKFRQRSKISRWSKIYDIYKNHCKGDLLEFEKLYSDKNGQFLPPTTIISMYESRDNDDAYNITLDLTLDSPSTTGPVVRKYVLPRRVDAKDIVKLWTKGCDDFPAINSWSKAEKIGQETKIFRWKKIVDIFLNCCDSDWDMFEELFSNEYGELLPTSAIIAKYETTLAKD